MDWLQGALDYGIIGILVAMSIAAVALAVERWLVYRAIDIRKYTDKRSLELELTQKLHVIATIGSNAPYVGLLGTVLGIMLTFSAMGKQGFMDTGSIMSGLALALKATAVGLLVAIPSVVLYNTLLRRVKVLMMQWEISHGREGV